MTTGPRLPKGKPLLRRVALYGASRGVTDGSIALRGLLLATVLGPAGFGAWALVRLGAHYASVGGFGIARALEIELLRTDPADRPTDVPAHAEHIARTGLGLVLIIAVTGAVAALAASFVVRGPTDALLLRAFAATVLVEYVFTYRLVVLRVHGNLRRYASVEMIHAALQLVVCGGGALLAGLPGAFAGLVLASLGGIALIPPSVAPSRPVLDRAATRRLARVALPLAGVALLAILLSSGDRWVVTLYGGTTLLGYYGFAVQIGGLASTAGLVVRTVVFRDVYEQLRSTGVGATVGEHLERLVLPFLRIYPVILGALAILVGPLIMLVLPAYAPAVEPARVILLVAAATGATSLGGLGAVAAGRQALLVPLYAVTLIVNLTGSALALRAGYGLAVVAAVSVASQTLFAAAVVWLNARSAGIPGPVWYAVRAFGPFAWCALVTVALIYLFPGHELGTVAKAGGVYVVAMVPLVRGVWGDVRRLA